LAFRKKERGGKVFVDWLRNAPYSTSVVPWSLRAGTGAPVAVPIGWDEVDSVDPDGVRFRSVSKRFGLDPWRDNRPQDLTSTAAEIEHTLQEAGIALEPFDRFRS
jgi:DNA primase